MQTPTDGRALTLKDGTDTPRRPRWMIAEQCGTRHCGHIACARALRPRNVPLHCNDATGLTAQQLASLAANRRL